MSDEDRSDVDDPPAPATAPTPSAVELAVEPGRTLAIVDWMSYVHLVLGLLALLGILALTGSAADSLTKILIGSILALALDTPVRRLQSRGLPRGAAAGLVCFAVLMGLGLVLGLLGPPAIREAAGFPEQLPATLAEMYDFPVVGGHLEDADVAARSDEWLAELPGTITADSVSEVLGRVVAGIASILQVLLLTLALLIDGEVLVRRVRSVIPEHLRGRADRAGRLVYDTLGRYFAGSLLLAGMTGTYVLTVGLIIGVPLIVFAAIWAMITDLIPQVGGFLGGSVFVTLALTDGALTGVIALGLFVAYMSAENYLIQPAVVGKAVNLSPPTTMLAAIMGGTAAGLPGAIIATPFVGSVKALYLAARYGTDGEGDDGGSPGDGFDTTSEEEQAHGEG